MPEQFTTSPSKIAPTHSSKPWIKLSSKIIFILLLITFVFLIATIFFAGRMDFASKKQIWLDENFAIKKTMRLTSYWDLLRGKAYGQGSPAPLDYFINKFHDSMRNQVHWFNLAPRVYYRLTSIIAAMLGAFVCFLFISLTFCADQTVFGFKAVQLLLLTCVPVLFLFHNVGSFYYGEIRPYALWNSLWFIVLAVSVLEEGRFRNGILIVAILLLAFSATASFFQIAMLLAAHGITLLIKDKNNIKSHLLKLAKLYAAPLLISFYYCLHSNRWGYPYDPLWWVEFQKLWNVNAILISMMLNLFLLAFIKKENFKYTLAPLATILLFLIGPLLFALVVSKGFFYHQRQYLYYRLNKCCLSFSVYQDVAFVFT